MPTEYLRRVWEDQPVVQVNLNTGRASRGAQTLSITKDESISTIIHEEHHAVENALPWVKRSEWAFLTSLAYEGEPGRREAKKGVKGRPGKYRLTKLASIYKWHGYGERETAIEDDLPHAYMGKVYGASYLPWTPDHLGGDGATKMNYEMLTMASESVLATRGNSAEFAMPATSSSFIGGQEYVPMRQTTLRTVHDWYLGQLLYAVHGDGSRSDLPGSSYEDRERERKASDDLLGKRLPVNSSLPSARIAGLRDAAVLRRGRTEIFRDGDRWTLRVSPIGAGPEAESVTVTWEVTPGRTPKMTRAKRVDPRTGLSINIGAKEIDSVIDEILVAQSDRRIQQRRDAISQGRVPIGEQAKKA
jgi:hypothetical protein